MIAYFGLRFKVKITTLQHMSKGDMMFTVRYGDDNIPRGSTHGVEIQKLKRNAMLSQLIAVSSTPKYFDDVVETEAKLSH